MAFLEAEANPPQLLVSLRSIMQTITACRVCREPSVKEALLVVPKSIDALLFRIACTSVNQVDT